MCWVSLSISAWVSWSSALELSHLQPLPYRGGSWWPAIGSVELSFKRGWCDVLLCREGTFTIWGHGSCPLWCQVCIEGRHWTEVIQLGCSKCWIWFASCQGVVWDWRFYLASEWCQIWWSITDAIGWKWPTTHSGHRRLHGKPLEWIRNWVPFMNNVPMSVRMNHHYTVERILAAFPLWVSKTAESSTLI